MRAKAWSEPVVDECEIKERETPRVAARMTRRELPRVPENAKNIGTVVEPYMYIYMYDKSGETSALAPFEELLEARVQELSISLNMSTALALAEFIEDEVIAPPMPLEVLIQNMKLHLVEDRPTRSISSPPPQPLDVDLTSLRLTRDTAGVVRLGPPVSTPSTIASPATPQPQPELEEARGKIDSLNKENEELKKRLMNLARIAEDNRELRAKAEEVSVLRQCVHTAQQEVSNLLADKQKLLEAMRVLQWDVYRWTRDGRMTWLKPRVHGGCKSLPTEATGGAAKLPREKVAVARRYAALQSRLHRLLRRPPVVDPSHIVISVRYDSITNLCWLTVSAGCDKTALRTPQETIKVPTQYLKSDATTRLLTPSNACQY
ncbi:hypothetical protein MSG28_009125 [Choristoneura fumiferana]|uniref:Uncharacterized protein n=1 Tax=Choristoneura fumiferana TaxID=7141 RepID=A0ACC0KW47_CHOFU|nr:hypothetical protein MSG28_009125 [Choristoneura fumiferana]